MDLDFGYTSLVETPGAVVVTDANDTIRDCIELFAAGNMFSKDLNQPFYSIWQEYWGRKLVLHTEFERHPAESELTLNQVFQYAIKASKRSTVSLKVPSMPLCDGQYESMVLRNDILDIDKSIEEDLGKGDNSFVLTSKPGVGKSTFIAYLLAKRLSERKPTFYHCPASSPNSPNDVFLFHGGGVARLTQTNTNIYLPLISAKILGIMEPHIGPYQPPMMFFQQAHPFVYAMSAGDEHQRWLSKLKKSFRTYTLKDWEPKEIFQTQT
ncbi:hypothetical protein CPB83DRAFT_855003 [Crepidotus variabilis]|uniref:Uncharacterized protein n=1 Tax=Crepidotus variabilis TaxID=179855 RepID=A0A9P6EFT4_9AGAR|nr:hypothetical protein CPB83DRAFT_855003 [Crepidotus variabilis]